MTFSIIKQKPPALFFMQKKAYFEAKINDKQGLNCYLVIY